MVCNVWTLIWGTVPNIVLQYLSLQYNAGTSVKAYTVVHNNICDTKCNNNWFCSSADKDVDSTWFTNVNLCEQPRQWRDKRKSNSVKKKIKKKKKRAQIYWSDYVQVGAGKVNNGRLVDRWSGISCRQGRWCSH